MSALFWKAIAPAPPKNTKGFSVLCIAEGLSTYNPGESESTKKRLRDWNLTTYDRVCIQYLQRQSKKVSPGRLFFFRVMEHAYCTDKRVFPHVGSFRYLLLGRVNFTKNTKQMSTAFRAKIESSSPHVHYVVYSLAWYGGAESPERTLSTPDFASTHPQGICTRRHPAGCIVAA